MILALRAVPSVWGKLIQDANCTTQWVGRAIDEAEARHLAGVAGGDEGYDIWQRADALTVERWDPDGPSQTILTNA